MSVRKIWMRAKRNRRLKSTSLGILGSVLPLKFALLLVMPTVVLCGHVYAAMWWSVHPPNQPDQICSKVDYDDKLTDPFFESEESSCWAGFTECMRWCPGGRPFLKHTAKCFSSSSGVKHLVRFCDAGLFDETILNLLINENDPSYGDALAIRIKGGKFECQYWGREGKGTFAWTTIRQKLTLDKKEYRKGDIVKGRIDFECVRKLIDPKDIVQWERDPSATIAIFGVFKATVE